MHNSNTIWYTRRSEKNCRNLQKMMKEMLHLRREKYQENIEGMQYQRYVEGEPKLSQLMTLYAHNLSRLYAVVSKKIQT